MVFQLRARYADTHAPATGWRERQTLTFHRRALLKETTLSGGGLDFYALKKVVLRTRKRPSRQWVYDDDTIQRIELAQELGAVGISLDDAAAAFSGASLDEIRQELATQPADRAGEWVSAMIARASVVPEVEEPAPAA